MTINLLSCDQDRPDRRTIARTIENIADGVDSNLANELTNIMLDGSAVEIEVSDNTSSAFRSLRKLGVDYEIVD